MEGKKVVGGGWRGEVCTWYRPPSTGQTMPMCGQWGRSATTNVTRRSTCQGRTSGRASSGGSAPEALQDGKQQCECR